MTGLNHRLVYWRLGLVCLIAVIAMPMAHAQGAKAITEIAITGNKNISKEAILGVVTEKPGVPFSRDVMTADRAQIEKMGFFSVVSARDEEVPGGVKVTFEVVENPKITHIVFTGNTVITRQELLDAMRTKEGQVYNSDTFLNQDLPAIEDIYAKKGYLAYVTNEADINAQTGVLTLPILEFRIGKIEFQGLHKTKPYVLLREMKLKPGMLYNANTLQKDITHIYELDILDVEKAQPPRREPGDQEGYINIIIPVTEKKTGQVSVGLGYSSLQKVVGRVEVSESNFQGKDLGLNALYEVSGIGVGPSYELGFYNPWFRKDHTSLSARVYDREIYRFSSSVLGGGSTFYNNADYQERRKGGTVTLSKPFGEQVRGYLTLRSEAVATSIAQGAVVDPNLILINQSGRVSSVAVRGTLDTRDFTLDPAHGTYLSLSVEPGWATIDPSTGNTFTKIDTDLRGYFSHGGLRKSVKDKRRVIAMRVETGWSTGSLPFWEQYFVGGAERLRGYQEDRFWGNKMFLSSLEYRVPLGGGLGGVLFADYGDAWGGGYGAVSPTLFQSSTFRGHLGYGAGIRVQTPIGNLRFDYGFGDEGPHTHFSIGQAF